VVVHPLPNLLERAGATLRGRNRADCPLCGGRRTVSYSEEVYCCHRAGCEFRGNAVTLARHLGLMTSRFSRAEAGAYHRQREEAQAAADYALQRLRAERRELYEACRSLRRIRGRAGDTLRMPTEDIKSWTALAYVDRELPRVEAALAILESAPVAVRLAFLNAAEADRAGAVEQVILAGGLDDSDGRFIEVRY
jgi:hypothetical protein